MHTEALNQGFSGFVSPYCCPQLWSLDMVYIQGPAWTSAPLSSAEHSDGPEGISAWCVMLCDARASPAASPARLTIPISAGRAVRTRLGTEMDCAGPSWDPHPHSHTQ